MTVDNDLLATLAKLHAAEFRSAAKMLIAGASTVTPLLTAATDAANNAVDHVLASAVRVGTNTVPVALDLERERRNPSTDDEFEARIRDAIERRIPPGPSVLMRFKTLRKEVDLGKAVREDRDAYEAAFERLVPPDVRERDGTLEGMELWLRTRST